jgi:SAM-dependent methyltransferase
VAGNGAAPAQRTGAELESAAARVRYGDLWVPSDEIGAMASIYNTTDAEGFELSGKADADDVGRLITRDDTVMDVGCGIGRVARYVAPRCKRLWAVDASPRMLEMARGRLSALDNVEYTRCEGTTIPGVADGSVDVVYSLLVLQHLEREDAFLLLRDIRRILRPGGTGYFTFPNLLSDVYFDGFVRYAESGETANPVRARIYTPQEADRIVRGAGFEVVKQVDDADIRVTCRAV